MKKIIKKLLEEKEVYTNKLDDLKNAIKALQKVCPHVDEQGKDTMEWYGDGHNKEYFRCSECQEEISR